MCIAHRMVRNVVLAVFCWFVVFVGIDAEHTEVACLTRPHPVVCIATKLTKALRWGKHQSHVIETLVNRQEVLTTFIIRCDFSIDAVDGIEYSLLQTGCYAVHIGSFLHLVHTRSHPSKHLVCHIHSAEVEGYVQFWIGQLILQTFGKETVLQVVVLDG